MDSQGNFADAQGFGGISTAEYDIFHFTAAQDAVFLFTQNPADGIDDIGFTTAVGADDSSNTLAEFKVVLFGKGFKAVDV